MKIRWFFPVFFLSGACALAYQVVWLRLAMARFGVTAPIVAIVLSVFMAGIAAGSLLAGRLARRLAAADASLPLELYGATELAIALSGLLVPRALARGVPVAHLLGAGQEWSSLAHYLVSGAWIAALLAPGTVAMGATVPLALWAIRTRHRVAAAESAFSYLYLANTIGALAGTLLTGFVLIERFGFAGTSQIAVVGNALIAAFVLTWSRRRPAAQGARPEATTPRPEAATTAPTPELGPHHLWALAATGFSALGMEVIWTRLFTPFLGTEVYAFALVLAIYLAATAGGAALHRRRGRSGRAPEFPGPAFWGLLAAAAFLPLLAADPRLGLVENPSLGTLAEAARGAFRVALGILPFSLACGYATPRLVDAGSRGEPKRAARAYAVNLLGCILGPLVAGFLLLPHLGERAGLVVLALPLAAIALLPTSLRAALPRLLPASFAALVLLVATRDAASRLGRIRIERDYSATSIAAGSGMDRRLLVNGVGMTSLTPITKMMAHLPIALLDHPPKSALVVCLGMGTTFRSIASWGIDATAVELVPGVVRLFDAFHDDAARVLAAPAGARIVVDDGRRFLERTTHRFDVITVDPPPPVTAAGSSLLYSKEFYATARARLAPGGIVQQWLLGGDSVFVAAATRALVEQFRYVRAFGSIEGWGIHFVASDHPIELPSREELERRIPPSAARDLVEWTPGATATALFARVLTNEISTDELLARSPGTPAVSDDRPFNEYYLLRTFLAR